MNPRRISLNMPQNPRQQPASQSTTTGAANPSKWVRALSLLFLLSFVLRIVFLYLAPNNTTDAWSRYQAALAWLQHPNQLPPATATGAWLPMHFWLLGIVLWISKSEISARLFSVFLGSLTVVLLAGIVDRTFCRCVAIWSAILLACFGFHVAFSVTTSSEALSIFLVALGTYAWVRYASNPSFVWLPLSATAFSVASLCRFEPWACAPVLGLMLLDWSSGWNSIWSNRQALGRALSFALLGSLGALAWLGYSYWRWGDALRLPHQTMWLNLHFQPEHHSIGFRLLVVPASIALSLSPILAALAVVGMAHVALTASQTTKALDVLACVLLFLGFWNALRYEATQARYTLLYSWLLLPFSLNGLCWLCSRWKKIQCKHAFVLLLLFFLFWQAGIMAGAAYLRPPLGDHLGALSPTIPPHREMRQLTTWLKTNGLPSKTVVLDDYNWESTDVFRLSNLNASHTFAITQLDYDDPILFQKRLEHFVLARHPEFLVCSPAGPIGKLWLINQRDSTRVDGLELHFTELWEGEHWRVYRITYS